MYRAYETDRPDALFRDPYARRLAGPEGEAIVRHMTGGRQASWSMVTRTVLFDEIVMRLEREGVDRVGNLACGLDTRPWRLDLPAELQWTDIDLPELLEHKGRVLGAEVPRCRYQAVELDLRDRSRRQGEFARLWSGTDRGLAMSEGLLIYLEAADVATLAQDLHAAGVRWWLIDLASPRVRKLLERRWGKSLERSPFRFTPEEGTAFFGPHGWREVEFRSLWLESHRIHREMPNAAFYRFLGRFYPQRVRDTWNRFSGVVLLERK
jgi:methyltransferase (TIGR00027 family)